MSRIGEMPLGPYKKWVMPFITISQEAYGLLRDFDPERASQSTNWLESEIVNLTIQAEATSAAARSSITHGYAVASWALVRVRLEQCIVFSFLTHSPFSDGWKRYYQDIRASDVEVELKAEKRLDPSAQRSKQEIEDLANALGPGAAFKNGRFVRTWTARPLKKMAEERDAIALPNSPIGWSLLDEFYRIYPTASFAVHGAAESTTWNVWLHKPELSSDKSYPYMLPKLAQSAAAAIARYDIIQAWEALLNLWPSSNDEVLQLLRSYELACRADA